MPCIRNAETLKLALNFAAIERKRCAVATGCGVDIGRAARG